MHNRTIRFFIRTPFKGKPARDVMPSKNVPRNTLRRSLHTAALFAVTGLWSHSAWTAQPLGKFADLDGIITANSATQSYTFTAKSNQSAILRLVERKTSTAPGDLTPQLKIFGPDGAILCSGVNYYSVTCIRSIAIAGTYTVVVSDGDKAPAGGYHLSFALAPGASEGGILPFGGRLAGAIDVSGDVDTYTFSANAGAEVMLKMAEKVQYAPLSPLLYVFGPTGSLVAQKLHNSVSSVTFSAPTDGVYTAVVMDGSNYGLATGAYDLGYFD